MKRRTSFFKKSAADGSAGGPEAPAESKSSVDDRRDLNELGPDAPRNKSRGWIVAGVVVVVVAAGVMLAAWPPAEADDPRDAPPTETTKVISGDLSEQIRLTGKLEFSNSREVGSALQGTVTKTAAPGTVVGRGGELFRVDDAPVVLMLGALPVWREFAEGMTDGPDIRQLEENLAALGFFEGTIDTQFRWSTIVAINRWQESLGLTETGRIEQGRIVFAPAEVHIQEVVVGVGSPVGGVILRVSDTKKEAIIDLDPNMAANAPVDTKVDVQLPNGTTTVGTITAVGSPVERENPNGGTTLRLPLTLVLDDPTVAAAFDTVTVSVTLTNVIAEDVLLVPVTALLAQPDGRTAVERVDRKKRSELVSVELGKFADGMVEVVAGELAEGDAVAVAQ